MRTGRRAGDGVQLAINGGLAGREVDEEIGVSALRELLVGGRRRNNDLQGLTFETDGGESVILTIGVESGNERSVVRREDLAEALGL